MPLFPPVNPVSGQEHDTHTSKNDPPYRPGGSFLLIFTVITALLRPHAAALSAGTENAMQVERQRTGEST